MMMPSAAPQITPRSLDAPLAVWPASGPDNRFEIFSEHLEDNSIDIIAILLFQESDLQAGSPKRPRRGSLDQLQPALMKSSSRQSGISLKRNLVPVLHERI
jgi:hypothetical protein